jgi:ubiquinone/menaquinone biosynthesis C-methylase UbiE
VLYNGNVESISFDPIAPVYDATRITNEASFNAALDYIVERFPPEQYPKLFEPGIGTGRIAIPLAERGYNVTGADISANMLKILADKLALRKPPLPVSFIQRDITALPFPDASFDLAVAVHIFHLIPEWKKAVNEVFRILKPGVPLVLMFTTSSMEAQVIKDRYREIAAEYGCSTSPVGVNSVIDLPDYLAGLGRRIEQIRGRWTWQQRVRIDKHVADLKAGFYSSTKMVPDNVHIKIMEKLELELKHKYGSLAIEVEEPAKIDLILALPG